MNSNFSMLSIIIPCYNEEKTLADCLNRVLEIADKTIELEIIVVDDFSQDRSPEIANLFAQKYAQVKLIRHPCNRGKGAALHTGFAHASGDIVAIQDADLEYDPQDLKRLIVPILNNKADVVIGSRFVTHGVHRVLYFWHSIGNRFLTMLSNMLTDLNLTDMETCYKVFKREILQSLVLNEQRFGFEPEIVAKIAQKNVRVYEMGISYYGRTYSEGKKIGFKDGMRALYCILKYNLPSAPRPIQFLIFSLLYGTAAIFNVAIFIPLYSQSVPLVWSVGIAFSFTGFFIFLFSKLLLFRYNARWNSIVEQMWFIFVIVSAVIIDYAATAFFIEVSIGPGPAKLLSNAILFILNFAGRKWLVFPATQTKELEPALLQQKQ